MAPPEAPRAAAVSALLLLLLAGAARAAPFTPGNLLTLRVGPAPDCSSTSGGSAFQQLPAYLVEISTNPASLGNVVQTISFPQAAAAAAAGQNPVSFQTSGSQGGLWRSENGAHVTFMGWANDVGKTAAGAVISNYTVAYCGASGACDTSAGSLGSGSGGIGGNNARAVITNDGANFYACGTNGIELIKRPTAGLPGCSAIGAGCNTLIQTAVNVYSLAFLNGQIFATSQKAGSVGLLTFNAPNNPPTAAAALTAPLPNSADAVHLASPQCLIFIDANKVLFCDTSTAAPKQGLQLFTNATGAWTWAATLATPDAASPPAGTTATQWTVHFAEFDKCTSTVYFTSEGPVYTRVWKSTFTAPATFSAPTLVASSLLNSIVRGLSMTPWSGGAGGACPAAPGAAGAAASSCPAGTLAGCYPSTTCAACPGGTFALAGDATCSACPVGTWSLPGAGACTSCPFGQPATSACPAMPGGYLAPSGLNMACPAGFFSNSVNASYCLDCPSGSFSPAPGARQCTPCNLLPGSYRALAKDAQRCPAAPLSTVLPFTPGNIVALRAGPTPDGSALNSGYSYQAYLDELSTDPYTYGQVVQTVALPSSQSQITVPGQRVLTLQTSQSQGGLSRSENGEFLSFMGWTADVALSSTASSSEFTVAVCYPEGYCDTATGSPTYTVGGKGIGGNNARSAVTNDGVNFWLTGTNGVEFAQRPGASSTCQAVGPGCSTMIQTATNVRALTIFENKLYASSQVSGYQGLSSFAVPLPTSATPLVNAFTLPAVVPQDIHFINATLLLLADLSVAGTGGLKLYSSASGSWVQLDNLKDPDSATAWSIHWFAYDSCSATVYFQSELDSANTATDIWSAKVDLIKGTFYNVLYLNAAPPNSIYQGVAMSPWYGGAKNCPNAAPGSPFVAGVAGPIGVVTAFSPGASMAGFAATNGGGITSSTDMLSRAGAATTFAQGSYHTAAGLGLPSGSSAMSLSAWVKCPLSAAGSQIAGWGNAFTTSASQLSTARFGLLAGARNTAAYSGYYPLISSTVVSFAGTPAPVNTCDLTGTNACFFLPEGIAFDYSGNLFIADSGANKIHKVMKGALTTTTFAGSDASPIGRAGNYDGKGTAALFNNPWQIVVGSLGFMYVTDQGNNKIRKIDQTGVVTTIAGGGAHPSLLPGQSGSASGYVDGTGTAALFRQPWGLALDATKQFLFVADYGNNKVRKVDLTTSVVTTIAGGGANGVTWGYVNGLGTSALFSLPEAVAVDASNNVWVSDAANAVIRKIAPGGQVSTPLGTVGILGSLDGIGTSAYFSEIYSMAFDASGAKLWVSDRTNDRLRLVDMATLAVTTPAGGAGCSDINIQQCGYNSVSGTRDVTNAVYAGPYAGRSGSTYPANLMQADIPYYCGSSTGVGASSWTGVNATTIPFTNPACTTPPVTPQFILDQNLSSGALYQSVPWLCPVAPSTCNSLVETTYGWNDGVGTNALFNYLAGLAVDPTDGSVWVADIRSDSIRRIAYNATLQQYVTTTPLGHGGAFAGGFADGAGSSAQLYGPWGMVFDSQNNMYVADYYNNAIRVVSPLGVVTTLAGGGDNAGGVLDGTGTSAQFYLPAGLALDEPNRVLYVADAQNNKVRAVNIDTRVVTSFVGGFNNVTRNPPQYNFYGTQNSYAPAGAELTQALYNTPFGGTAAALNNGYNLGYCTSGYGGSNNGVCPNVTIGGASVANVYVNSTANVWFDLPLSVALDGKGFLYVADSYGSSSNNNIRRVSIATRETGFYVGSQLAGVGEGVGSAALFRAPGHVLIVTVGATQIMYISDTGNHKIRAVNMTSRQTSTVAGGGGAVTTATGIEGAASGFADGPGSNALFDAPYGLAYDSASGDIYVVRAPDEKERDAPWRWRRQSS